MYDVFSSCQLLSYYKYTRDTIRASACSGLLHAITRQGIETYTVRVYAAASDWIRANAAVDIKVDQQKVEEQSSAEHGVEEGKTSNVVGESEQSSQDESKTAAQFSLGCDSENDSSSSADVVSTKSAESGDMISKTSEDFDQEPQNIDTIITTKESSSSSTCETNLNSEALGVETPVKSTTPSGGELSHKSSPSNKEDDSPPSNVKLTVDNSGRTLVRFTSGSRTPSPAVTRKETRTEDDFHNESNPELTAVQRTKAFPAMNPLSRSISSSTKLSDAAQQASVNKLASDCGWTLPVFDLESLRQVGSVGVS